MTPLDRINSCARTAETHAVLAAGSDDLVVVDEAAYDARTAADTALALANAVLPLDPDLRAAANRADLHAREAQARVIELQARSKQRRLRQLAPALAAIRSAMPGVDAVIANDSQAAAAMDAIRDALLLLQYRCEVTKQ